MSRKLWLKATSIALLLFIPFALRLARTTFAGAPEPPPGFTQIKGPNIEGELTAMFVDVGAAVDINGDTTGTAAAIVAKCKGHEFVLGPFFFPGDQTAFTQGTTKATLESGWILYSAAPAGCFSQFGGETLFLDKVKHFDTQTDTLVIADVKIIGIQ